MTDEPTRPKMDPETLESDGPDPVRAAETTDTGDRGPATAVKAFADFGWPATLTTAAQDLGTDVLIAARDRRFHRGEYLGAQVKSGDSNLDSPITESDGTHVGWWVTVTAKHADYWIDNAIPHILILYDHTTDRCHWAHLTDETIERTGRGRKVKVPSKQVVSADQAEDLLAVAATARAEVPLEGTAWTGAAPKALTDHLRFALIAPRLMAPHPNSGLGPAGPAEAVALLMQARKADVWPLGTAHDGVPSRKDAATSRLWGWRFVLAVADWLTSYESPDFEALRKLAPSTHERAAVTAVIAHRSMAAGDPESARALLQAEIDTDQLAPVDRAWLHLQLSRAHEELANLDDARHAATLSLAIGATQRHDVTATAIRGVAAAILFDTTTLGERDIASTIRYSDTAVAWWRSLIAYRGTVALVQTAFDRAIGHQPSDGDGIEANNQLFAASVQAGLLGSHGQWRHLSGLLARQEFVDPTASSHDRLADTLGALRHAGDEQAAWQAAAWVADNGPADAVADATRLIDLTRSTSSSILADVEMLRVAGDILDEDVATGAADWLETALEDPTRLQTLTHRHAYDPQQWIAAKLEGIFKAIPSEGAERTVRVIERYGADFEVLAARGWASVIIAIPRRAWTSERAARLMAASTVDDTDLAAAIAFVSQTHDPTARDALVDLVRAGRMWAISWIDDLHTLAPHTLDEVRSICLARVQKDCTEERAGTLARGVDRPLDSLVTLGLADSTDAVWDVVRDVIADHTMPAWYKQEAIGRVATTHAQVPGSHRAAIAAAIQAAGNAPPSTRWRGGDADLTGPIGYATAVLDSDPEEPRDAIARLAGGSELDRCWASHLAGGTDDVASLRILVTDRSPWVRAQAAHGLARALRDDIDIRAAGAGLRRAVADRGRATGLAVSSVIADAPNASDLAEVRDLLADHPSAEVRRRARVDG